MGKIKGIETRKLNIGYSFDLVGDISLEAKPGKILTIIGPNGCGKSTLLKTIMGELKERSGVIYLNGQDKRELKPALVAKSLAMVMTYKVKPELMTCREVVEVGRYPYTGRLGILSDTDKELVKEAMESTDVADIADSYFTNISDGQRQRVLLARAICQEPEVLILDEPTSFLDIKHKLDILNQIKRIVKEKNIAVVMSLHELEIARRISDTVAAMGEGKILRVGTPSEVFEEAFIRKLYGIEGMDIDILGAKVWDAKDEGLSGAVTSSFRPGVIMVQGTMSNAGKSVIAAGLCRIFANDGYKVAPFKSQNMALNSFVTEEGLEMGRAQVMQAECARIKPLACMNPILLKPTSDMGSQVIVNGKVVGNMRAMEYFRNKKKFVPDIMKAFDELSKKADIIVIEGAGSPVELNLKSDDIVNMGLAEMLNAPVLLVGDIDRGGIFPQLLGTLDLLEPEERSRVKGLVVNKFRGDSRLFEDGVKILEKKGNTKVVGVVPYMQVKLDDEDSLSERFYVNQAANFDIAVIKLRHISNFTDFDTFEQLKGVSVRYVESPKELGDPDLIILPGTKNTISDLRAIKESGLGEEIVKRAGAGLTVMGICGGYQMLGRRVDDPYGVEEGGSEEGLNLLPVDTVLGGEKIRSDFTGKIKAATGVLCGLSGLSVEGYEIHMGSTEAFEEITEFTSGKTGFCKGNVYGTYLHGFFDKKEIMTGVTEAVSKERNKSIYTAEAMDYAEFKETQYELLDRSLRAALDMDYIYEIMGIKR